MVQFESLGMVSIHLPW